MGGAPQPLVAWAYYFYSARSTVASWLQAQISTKSTRGVSMMEFGVLGMASESDTELNELELDTTITEVDSVTNPT